MNNTNIEISETSIIISREIYAPIELVWLNWSKAERLSKWYGPDGFSITTDSFEFKAGGEWIFNMHGPDGTLFPNKIIYENIKPLKEISIIHTGNAGGVDISFTQRIIFEKLGEVATKITMNSVFEKPEILKYVIENYAADEGGKQTLARLSNISEEESEETVIVSKILKHPAETIYDAFLNPEIASKFLFATDSGIMKTCEIDAKPFGKFNIIETRDGIDAVHIGQYLQLTRPNTIIFSFGDNIAFKKTIVSIDISQTLDGTLLILIHRGVEAEWLEQTYKGWSDILEKLNLVL